MKRIITLLSALFLLASLAYAQHSGDRLASVLDLSIGLQELGQAARTSDDRAIPGDKLLLLNATVGSIVIFIDDGEDYSALLELIEGYWADEHTLVLNRCFARCDGASFREFFDAHSVASIARGDRILVSCRYLGLITDQARGGLAALVEAYGLRRR